MSELSKRLRGIEGQFSTHKFKPLSAEEQARIDSDFGQRVYAAALRHIYRDLLEPAAREIEDLEAHSYGDGDYDGEPLSYS